MTLKETFQQELKNALKKKDKIRLETVRAIINAIKNHEINNKVELNDEGIYKILSSLAKQRKDSIEQFKKGGRDDLVTKEAEELKIISEFLPEQLSISEIEKIVQESIDEIGAKSLKDMGKVMKLVLSKVKGRADGKTVSEIVKKSLE